MNRYLTSKCEPCDLLLQPMPKKRKHTGIEYEDEPDDASDRSPHPNTKWKMELKDPTGTGKGTITRYLVLFYRTI